MNDNYEKPFASNDSSARYMSAHEQALARARMEQAMALADWSVRAWDGLRAALNRGVNALRRAGSPRRGVLRRSMR